MKYVRPLALLAVSTAAACSDPSAPATPALEAPDAPTLAKNADDGDEAQPIPGQYIVVFRDAVGDPESKAHEKEGKLRSGKKLKFVYKRALKGFAGELAAEDVEALRADPDVAYVEQDQVVTASTTQTGATWGLDRIDQSRLPLSTTFGYTKTGAGVTAYIIDTGIRFAHAEFGGRAVSGYDAVDGGSADDCNGHGTHVAGTVGGASYGVAKGVTLIAVRVLSCSGSGSNAGVIAGIDWVTRNHVKPAVANMSLGGGASTALDNAVVNSIAAGVTYAVAAGNGNQAGRAQNACNYSPARVGAAITVGATDKSDTKTSWSNYGDCVDLFAPGLSITSSWYTSNTATNTISGTSMATPHVAGVAALYLQGSPGASPAAVRTALVGGATQSIVKSAKTTNNHLLFTSY